MSGLIVIIGGLYIVAALIIWLGLGINRNPNHSSEITTGSLIICGRDEQRDLPACLQSVEEQTLAPDQLEVILVNDASQDRTGQLMEEYARTSKYPVKVLHMSPPQPGEPSGKWRPLKEGIKLAHHEGLLLTDADAVLSPAWAERHLAELGKAEVSAGFALIDGKGLWNQIQCLDWLFLLGAGSSMARWGVPEAALGKNLAVRRADYDAAGGLESIGFTLTEDRALMRALVARGAKVSFPLAADMLVSTPGVPTWSDYMHQRKRWASGIRRLKPTGKFCVAAMALRHLSVIIGTLAGLPEAWWIWGASAAANFIILRKTTTGLGLKKRLRFFIFWEVFYTWTAPFQAFYMLKNRRVVWKGRKFPRSTLPAETS